MFQTAQRIAMDRTAYSLAFEVHEIIFAILYHQIFVFKKVQVQEQFTGKDVVLGVATNLSTVAAACESNSNTDSDLCILSL